MAHPAAVDLRSDTVTRPTAAMRRAIAAAVVGDDVFGDDPTVRELERRMAALAGKPAALFVPSGTMGNQLAVRSLTEPGDAVLLDRESHVFRYEQAGVAANSGLLAFAVESERGVITPALLEQSLDDHEDDHVARLALVCVENTHNRHGGAVVPLAALAALAAAARARGVRLHLDGARLWNASVATGVPVRDWAAHADTASMCFSKGLGAPVGSVVAGEEAVIRRARRLRKRWGGAMRQVGILAAACLHALDHHVERLAEDHRRARALAEGLRRLPGVRVSVPETNILFADLEHPALEPSEVHAALEARGVRWLPFGPRRLRAITHLDVDDDGVARAIAAFQAVVEERLGAASRRA
jgi:threonine aldolase